MYERAVRAEVEEARAGGFVVVDVTIVAWEVDEDYVVASDRALARNPNAHLYFTRAGRPAACWLGTR